MDYAHAQNLAVGDWLEAVASCIINDLDYDTQQMDKE